MNETKDLQYRVDPRLRRSSRQSLLADRAEEMALSMVLLNAALSPTAAFPTEMLTTGFVAAAFGGGLIPSLMTANKKAVALLLDDSTSAPAASRANGPCLRCSPLLLYPQPLTLSETLSVASRLSANAEQLWDGKRRTPTGRVPLLRRADFDACVRGAPPRLLSIRDGASDGAASDGAARDESLLELSPIAMDACWTALSGGNPYVSKEEVARQLSRWRPDTSTFVQEDFEKALLIGRANILLGFLVLFGMQATVVLVLVVSPLLKGLGLSAS